MSPVVLPMYSGIEEKRDSATDHRQRTPQPHRHTKKAARTTASCQQLPAGSVDDAGDCQAGCSGTAGQQQDKAEGENRRSARLSHSEIEKRRRNKLNAFIYELAGLLPKRDGVHQSKKLDKLSILRLSVHHLRNSAPKSALNPTPDTLLKEYMGQFVQILMDADEFLTFIIDGQTETFMYVSEPAAKALEITQAETQNLPISYIVHPDDLQIVRQQFHQVETPTTPSIFSCRMKTRTLTDHGIAKFDPQTHKSFLSLTCYGLIKKQSDMAPIFSASTQPGRSVLLVLAAMNDLRHPTSQSHLTPDGKLISGDERFSQWLGCSEKMSIGTSVYQYCHPADVGKLAKGHRRALDHAEVVAVVVRFVGRSGPVRVVGTWRAVRRAFDNVVEGIDVAWTLQY